MQTCEQRFSKLESVYSTLFLGYQKSGKFQISVKDVANGRCLVDMYIPSTVTARAVPVDVFTYNLREAPPLLVQLGWALPEPLIAGRATSTALTLFLTNLMPKR